LAYLACVPLPQLLAGVAGLGLVLIIIWDAFETVLVRAASAGACG